MAPVAAARGVTELGASESAQPSPRASRPGHPAGHERDPHIRRQVRPAGHRLALLAPAAASELRCGPVPETRGGSIGILERDLARAGMLGDDRAHGLEPDSGPPHRPHHEEAAEDAHRAGEAADDREPYSPVRRPGEYVARPVAVIECRDQPPGPERAVRVRQPRELLHRLPDATRRHFPRIHRPVGYSESAACGRPSRRRAPPPRTGRSYRRGPPARRHRMTRSDHPSQRQT
jgi:hypothetical protein